MKKVLFVLLIAAFVMPAFVSCKKGANDPTISFASRKARLAGEWKVTKMITTSTAGTNTTTTTYDNGTYTYNDGGVITSGTYTWDWTIEKNGSYNYKRILTISGTTQTYDEEGLWYFAGANKDEDIKNKEMVCFQSTKRTYTSGGGTDVYTEEGNTFNWYKIDQLKSKEIIGTYDWSITGTSTWTSSTDVTLTAK